MNKEIKKILIDAGFHVDRFGDIYYEGILCTDTLTSVIRRVQELTENKLNKIKTYDGKVVKPGDTVWVFGSCSIEKAKVRKPEALTDYYYFEDIPVKDSFSTKEAAEKHRKEISNA